MEWISETSLLYFFSALAQCAAGFAALIGVFTVFRLQTNAHAIIEEYSAAKNWLSIVKGLSNVETMPRQEVKSWLQKVEAEKSGSSISESAKNVLLKIQRAEEFDRQLVLKASAPLKYWAYIFFFSMGIIPFVKFYFGLYSFLVILFFLGAVIGTLVLTKKFVQTCLSF